MTEQEFYRKTLSDLVSISSVSQHEKNAAEYVATVLRSFGYSPELQSVGDDGANVIANIGGSSDSTCVLGGHLDTVPICNGWQRDPMQLTIEGNRAYGLGACDMKGGIAALLTILRRYEIAGERPAWNITFAALADEERLSLGAETFSRSGLKADFCILAEPHFDEFVIGSTGKILLQLSVHGKNGHAAKPETGVNAIECMTRFMSKVDQKYRRLYLEGEAASHCVLHIWNDYPHYSLSIPDTCHVLMNKQLLLRENSKDFEEDLKSIFHQSCPEATLTIERKLPYYPAYQTDTESENFTRLHDLAQKCIGKTIEFRVNQSVSDGNVIEPVMGIPTVVFGPKGVGCHQPDEYLVLDSVWKYIDTLYSFLGVADGV